MGEEKRTLLTNEFIRTKKPFTQEDVDLALRCFDKYGDIATVMAIRAGCRGRNFIAMASLAKRVARYAYVLPAVKEFWEKLREKLEMVTSREEFRQKIDVLEREYIKYGFISTKLYGKRPFSDTVDASIERLSIKRSSPFNIILRDRDIVYASLASRLSSRFALVKASNFVYEFSISRYDEKTRSFKKEYHWQMLEGPEVVFGALLIRRYPDYYAGIFSRCLKHVRNYNQFGILISYAMNFGPSRFHSALDIFEKKKYMLRDFCAGIFNSLRPGMKDYFSYISDLISRVNEYCERMEKIERVAKMERVYELTDSLKEQIGQEFPGVPIVEDEVVEIRPEMEDILMNTKFTFIAFEKGAIRIPSGQEILCIRARTKTQIGVLIIDRVGVKKLGDLTDDDAFRDGFKEKSEMINRYKQIYAGLEETDLISIYHIQDLKVE